MTSYSGLFIGRLKGLVNDLSHQLQKCSSTTREQPEGTVSQIEKLSAYAGTRKAIRTVDDVRCMASDTKIDTVFEFSKALANRDLEKSIRMMQILFREAFT